MKLIPTSFAALSLCALLASPARAQLNGIIVANTTYGSPAQLTGATVAVGALAFDSTLDGGHRLTVAGDLRLGGDVGTVEPLADVSVAGRIVFDALALCSTGLVSTAGQLELTRGGAELTAATWDVAGQLLLRTAGTYTIRASAGDIKLRGQLRGPGAGIATLRLVVPHGQATLVYGVPANVIVQTVRSDSDPAPDRGSGRLVNVSTRAAVGTGDEVLIVGFVVGRGDRTVLVRAVGPTLGVMGVSQPLRYPELEIVDRHGNVVRRTAGWNLLAASEREAVREAAAAVGAFALDDTSDDAAQLLRLAPGVYSMIVRGRNGTTGTALAEVYEVP